MFGLRAVLVAVGSIRHPGPEALARPAQLGRPLAIVMAALVVLAGSADAQGIFDFVTFDGIDYIRWAEEPGRALSSSDLGAEFAAIGCSIAEDRQACQYGADAAAAFMPTGTRMYAVRGHSTDFRLAAAWKDRLFLYQAWRNPRAKLGGQLYQIAGKVRAIDVQRGEPHTAGSGTPVAVASVADADALVEMIARAPVRRPQVHAFGEPRYWLTFWLVDGTTLGRPYYVETSELMGGVILPDEFRRILERYLAN